MLDYFVNDKYKVLECMFKRQISVNGFNIVKLSQQEIADILSLTKPKVNAIIAELKNNGYIEQQSNHGKYILTAKAISELTSLKNKEIK